MSQDNKCMAVQVCPRFSGNTSGVKAELTVSPGNSTSGSSNAFFYDSVNFSVVQPNSQPAPGCNVISVCDHVIINGITQMIQPRQ